MAAGMTLGCLFWFCYFSIGDKYELSRTKPGSAFVCKTCKSENKKIEQMYRFPIIHRSIPIVLQDSKNKVNQVNSLSCK